MTDMNASTFSRVPLDDVNYISLAAFAAKNDAMCEDANYNTEDVVCIMHAWPGDYFTGGDIDAAVVHALHLGTDANLQLVQSVAKKCARSGADKGSSITCMLPCYEGSTTVSPIAGAVRSLTLCMLPTACSRNNTPSLAHSVTLAVKAARGSGDLRVVLLPSNPKEMAVAQAVAVARAFPMYSDKKDMREKLQAKISNKVTVVVQLERIDGDTSPNFAEDPMITEIRHLGQNVRICANLVDLPPNLLNCTTYTAAALDLVRGLNGVNMEHITTKVIKGKELEAQGFGGLYGVGKASEHPPALVILSYNPPGAEDAKSICMVGKGIVYDTGGLSIKVPPNMAGMKTDMGGSAACLLAFRSLVMQGDMSKPIHALLCIAENSVDERATRPDDVHIMLSGKSVEVNNTDAEGRLVLGDGVHYAATYLNPYAIIDIATLTGAQLVTTGKRHAALYCSQPWLEDIALNSGKYTGDLVFPMLYCPEFHRAMFESPVADMKNSVSDRMNAQASCAGQFIGNHLEAYLEAGGAWCHVDMAGPSMTLAGDRATGYGVALLYDIARDLHSKY